MSSPVVSVVIPVRNGRDFIYEAIVSVCDQDFSDLEVIVIDDGSDDFNYQELCNFDERIQVHRLNGRGVSGARNFGMSLSKGRYLAFLDADDVWFPGKLSAQIAYFEKHPEIGCVFGAFKKWYPNSEGKFTPAKDMIATCSKNPSVDVARSGWLYTRLLTGLLVGMNTAVIRREVYDLLAGFDESRRIGEDYLFWLKVSRLYEMHALDCEVALYRIHPASAMSRLDTENHQTRLLEIAVSRWGLRNPDGSGLSKAEFNRRMAESEFTHGYNHFWHGSSAVARNSFYKSIYGGVMPYKSAAYLLLLPFRGLFR